VFEDEPPLVVKIGMLTSPETISALGEYLSSLPHRPLTILDPVMISTSGHTLLPDQAIANITSRLLPHVDWVTPNIPEAQRLVSSSSPVSTLADLLSLAREIRDAVPAKTILLKGGHLGVTREQVNAVAGQYDAVWEEGDEEEETVEILSLYRRHVAVQPARELVVDVLIQRGEELKLFVGKRLESTSTHGTGCTLSSAIASLSASAPGEWCRCGWYQAQRADIRHDQRRDHQTSYRIH
jgi:hydroxymethylpyrimidine/phosphomethylpyrimidine kinase